MKIARIEKFILRATLARPFAYSQGWYKERTALIVRILTDDGLEGVGECFGPPEPAAAVIDNVFEPLLEYDCSEHPLRTDVINERIAPDGGGMVEVPQNPGLGVSLNLEFVKGLARRAV
jgi:D-galactarolactone cycloisomerase